MSEQRLHDWLAGLLPDEQLTPFEIGWLQVATFEAVERKLQAMNAPEQVQ